LYQDRSIGDIIAGCATDACLEYVRIDRNASYRRTPMTRWLEECASWCAGGWKIGDPPLISLIQWWTAFQVIEGGESEALLQTRKLVRFLSTHRNPSMSLKDWLSSFGESCLRELFRRDLTLGDEAHAFKGLVTGCEDGGRTAGWSVRRFGGQGGSPDHLSLMTLHSSKGLEFDVVFMLGMDQGCIPRYDQKTPESKRESRRLFYVGLTRARNEVHLLYTGWRQTKYGRRFVDGPSEFLEEVRRSIV
jgi:DNA helicase-2/ATP-dependent DNA helicase PcrA